MSEEAYEIRVKVPVRMRQLLEHAITKIIDDAELFDGWVEWDQKVEAALKGEAVRQTNEFNLH